MGNLSHCCPFCGTPVTVVGPCEKCMPKSPEQILQGAIREDPILQQSIVATEGDELKDIIFNYVNAQPEKRLHLDTIIARIKGAMPNEHTGSVKRALRFLLDEGRVKQIQETIVIN